MLTGRVVSTCGAIAPTRLPAHARSALGAASGLEQRPTTRRIAGPAVTDRLVPADLAPQTVSPSRHLGTTAIELAQPCDVIVVEQCIGIDAGSWGRAPASASASAWASLPGNELLASPADTAQGR